MHGYRKTKPTKRRNLIIRRDSNYTKLCSYNNYKRSLILRASEEENISLRFPSEHPTISLVPKHHRIAQTLAHQRKRPAFLTKRRNSLIISLSTLGQTLLKPKVWKKKESQTLVLIVIFIQEYRYPSLF